MGLFGGRKLTNAEILLNGYYPDDEDYRHYLMSRVIEDHLAEKEAARAQRELLRIAEEQERAAQQSVRGVIQEGALKKLKELLAERPDSLQFLTENMQIYGFSAEETLLAAQQHGVDWARVAVRNLKEYEKKFSEAPSFGRAKAWLRGGGFPEEVIEEALSLVGLTAEDYAMEAAMEGLADRRYSNQRRTPKGLRVYLRMKGFTDEQITYAMKHIDWGDQGAAYLREWVLRPPTKSRPRIPPADAAQLLQRMEYDYQDAKRAVFRCAEYWKMTKDELEAEL